MFNILTLNKIAACGTDRLGTNYNVADDEFLIGIVARLNEVKGHIYLLEALKMLWEYPCGFESHHRHHLI